jgi:hypothetical protein
MRQLARVLRGAAIIAATLLLGGQAAADGLVVRPTDLSEPARATLARQIASHRRMHPEDFAALGRVQGHRPEVYRAFRNPVPMVGRELFGLGKGALLPMLEALAFKLPDVRGLGDDDRDALAAGMLTAVGRMRDGRAATVLHAAFKAKATAAVTLASAEAIGRLCDGSSVDLLRAALSDPVRRDAAIAGLGQCRGVEAAGVLGAELGAVGAPEEAATVSRALGAIGSSWAWDALGQVRAAEGLEVRRIAATALVRSFVRFGDEPSRKAATVALRLCAHPDFAAIVTREAGAADAATRQALAALAR